MLGTQKIPRIPASAATAILTSGNTNNANTNTNATPSPGTFTWRNLASQALFTGARTFLAAKDGEDAAIQALGSGIGQYLGNTINALVSSLFDKAGQGANHVAGQEESSMSNLAPRFTESPQPPTAPGNQTANLELDYAPLPVDAIGSFQSREFRR